MKEVKYYIICSYCGVNPIEEVCKHPKKCSDKEKIKTPTDIIKNAENETNH